jgi:hypothetical protein
LKLQKQTVQLDTFTEGHPLQFRNGITEKEKNYEKFLQLFQREISLRVLSLSLMPIEAKVADNTRCWQDDDADSAPMKPL